MNTYVVTLSIQAGEYEKSNIVLVKAITEEEARKEALLSECHGSLDDDNLEWSDRGIYDLHGQFHYSVNNCVLVSCNHVAIVSQYIGNVILSGASFSNRGALTIMVDPSKNMFHVCRSELSGINQDAWYPYIEGELFQYVERLLVAAGAAINVVTLTELRRCGNVIDYQIDINY